MIVVELVLSGIEEKVISLESSKSGSNAHCVLVAIDCLPIRPCAGCDSIPSVRMLHQTNKAETLAGRKNSIALVISSRVLYICDTDDME